MKLGLDCLIASRALRKELRGKRLALLAHPASVTRDLTHALEMGLPQIVAERRERAGNEIVNLAKIVFDRVSRHQ